MTKAQILMDNLRAFVGVSEQDSDLASCYDNLMTRIQVLNEYSWEHRIDAQRVKDWLENFDGRTGADKEEERLHALFLLSQFLYFGTREIRVLLRSLYRDLFVIPLIQELRRRNNWTRNERLLSASFSLELSATRFLGMGNPSESGVHLLYYFRQENQLATDKFLDAARLYSYENGKVALADPTIKRYVFLDDFCGSGETALSYSQDFLKKAAEHPGIQLCYYCMFATNAGLQRVKNTGVFGKEARAVFELDETYKCFSERSRYLKLKPPQIDGEKMKTLSYTYGARLNGIFPVGHDDGQLLIGFSHNIPDNTLPIIWHHGVGQTGVHWTPVFRRHRKI